MRTSLFGGLLLVAAAPLLIALSSLLDLELESVVLVGTALGAVVAIVPDRTPSSRLLGFVSGVLIGWACYIIRAGFLPDTSTGRAAAVAITLALCVLVVVASRDRVALWTLLLGAGGFAGAYEFTFAVAPTEVLASSLSAATSFLVAFAVGFVVCSTVQPAPARRHQPLTDTSGHRLGDRHNLVMENSE